MAKKRKGGHRFVSKAQWRYLHAKFGHKGFVKRWARKQRGQYKSLPKKKRGKR
jgi:hypothetical protein